MLHTTSLRRAAVLLLCLGCGAGPAVAGPDGCWLPGESLPGIDVGVVESCTWDPDGAGPASEVVLFGGGFTTAGGTVASKIVGWDGESWITFGDGLPGQVDALAIYDGLPVAGTASYDGSNWHSFVSRWDGTRWQQVGAEFGQGVNALAVYNGELIAGGWFTAIGGTQARGLAKWTGSEWIEFAGGVAPQTPGFLTAINALHVQDGSLFVGGGFGFAGGVAARNIARWDGAWHSLGVVDGEVRDLTSHAGQLAVCGSFNHAGGVAASEIALWDGVTWTSPGGGIAGTQGTAQCIASFQGELYVGGGIFSYAQALRYIVKWNGAAWESPGGGTNYDVFTLVPTSQALYAGGLFTTAGETASNCISAWDGNLWSALASGINDDVYCVEQFRDDIIIGGRFIQAGDTHALGIARKVDGRWEPLGDGVDGQPGGTVGGVVFDLEVFRNDLIACGYFFMAGGTEVRNIARWDGAAWHALDGGFDQYSFAYAITKFQGDLIVCGQMHTAGGVPVQRIARWDGHNWHPMGLGANAFPGTPQALAVYRGKLIAGGASGGGATLPVVAEWTGQHWQQFDGLAQQGYYATVKALAAYHGDLIAAGDFIRPNNDGRDIARWDGHQWHSMGAGPSLGQGVGGDIWALAVAGGELIAGGLFIDMDNLPANSIARWDGETWSAMGGGLRGGNPLVRQLNRIGNSLHAVGGFTIADDRVSAHLARWRIGGSRGRHRARERRRRDQHRRSARGRGRMGRVPPATIRLRRGHCDKRAECRGCGHRGSAGRDQPVGALPVARVAPRGRLR